MDWATTVITFVWFSLTADKLTWICSTTDSMWRESVVQQTHVTFNLQYIRYIGLVCSYWFVLLTVTDPLGRWNTRTLKLRTKALLKRKNSYQCILWSGSLLGVGYVVILILSEILFWIKADFHCRVVSVVYGNPFVSRSCSQNRSGRGERPSSYEPWRGFGTWWRTSLGFPVGIWVKSEFTEFRLKKIKRLV